MRFNLMERVTSARCLPVVSGVLAMLLLGGRAQADVEGPGPEAALVPAACARYWAIPGGIASPATWNQALSFAACVEDASVTRVDDADQLADLVDRLETALVPALEVYAIVVEDAPGPVKVRATLHIAMTQLALITRARSAIVAPSDLATNPAAFARYHALHAQLEPQLDQPARFACELIAVIDREIAQDPSLVGDAVTRRMLASVRAQTALLQKHRPLRRDELEIARSRAQGAHSARWDWMPETAP